MTDFYFLNEVEGVEVGEAESNLNHNTIKLYKSKGVKAENIPSRVFM